MGKAIFLNSNNWINAKVSEPIISDGRVSSLNDFMPITAREELSDPNKVTGSDAIEVVSGGNNLVAVEGNGGVREMLHADRVVVFINPHNRLGKVILYQDNKFLLKVRPNLNRVEALSEGSR